MEAGPAARNAAGKRMFILDEPTTGLAGSDIRQLLRVFNRLIGEGHTLLVIEHNLELIANADYVIDLGPEGGDEGGQPGGKRHAAGGGRLRGLAHRARIAPAVWIAG